MVDTGPVITPPGQYTHCVDRKDYKDVPGVLSSGIPATLEFLLCDYLLGGKLVCLAGGGDECGIGVVVGLEAVGAGKSGIDALDNDFSFNLLLAPYLPDDFGTYSPVAPGNIVDPHRVRDDIKRGPLGWLMVDTVDPSTLPAPVDQTGAPGAPFKSKQPQGTATWPVDGYCVLWKLQGGRIVDANREGDNLHKLWDKPPNKEWSDPPTTDQWISLPVLHCECEGSRIFFVCQAMMPFLDLLQGKPPGGGGPSPGEVCHAVAGWLPWPASTFVDAVCSVVEGLIAIPIALALAPAMGCRLRHSVGSPRRRSTTCSSPGRSPNRSTWVTSSSSRAAGTGMPAIRGT